MTRLPTPKMRKKALAALYKDFGWDDARQQGFNRRCCGHDHPRTTAEANKIYQGLEAILTRLLTPYYTEIHTLVNILYAERYMMSVWERDTFLPDVKRRLEARTPDSRVRPLSPKTVKKIREIAHKYGIDCGFPSVRELAQQYNSSREEREETQRKTFSGSSRSSRLI